MKIWVPSQAVAINLNAISQNCLAALKPFFHKHQLKLQWRQHFSLPQQKYKKTFTIKEHYILHNLPNFVTLWSKAGCFPAILYVGKKCMLKSRKNFIKNNVYVWCKNNNVNFSSTIFSSPSLLKTSICMLYTGRSAFSRKRRWEDSQLLYPAKAIS